MFEETLGCCMSGFVWQMFSVRLSGLLVRSPRMVGLVLFLLSGSLGKCMSFKNL